MQYERKCHLHIRQQSIASYCLLYYLFIHTHILLYTNMKNTTIFPMNVLLLGLNAKLILYTIDLCFPRSLVDAFLHSIVRVYII